MRVGVYFPDDNDLHVQVLSAMAAGIHGQGDQLNVMMLEDFVTHPQIHDAAVVFGVRKRAVPKSELRGKVFDAYREAGKNVLVLERGYVRRDEYHAAGWNGLNGRANFRNESVPGDRWRDLGVPLKPWRKSTFTDPVVVIGQVPWDASVQNINHLEWIAGTCHLLMNETDREISVRPHPLAKDATPLFLGASRCEDPLDEVLKIAHAVVTYNSNVGVDALIAGVPVFTDDEGSMVHKIANHALERINAPETPDREAWARSIAYAQWNLEEMRSGLAWRHLREVLL